MYWNLIVITLCLLLLFFLIFKENQRPNRSCLALRMIASTFAVVSLACITIPVSINTKQNKSNLKETILLTEAFNYNSVQKLLAADKDIKIYTTNKDLKIFNATHLPDVSVFDGFPDNIKAVQIFGYGLDKNELSQLNNIPVLFHPANIENKITSINWTQKLRSGEPIIVQGTFNNTSYSTAQIVLNGFNTNLDSFKIGARQTSYFQLTATPKHLDKAVYSILILSGNDTLEQEPIPVEVNAAQPFSILLLAASPDFENKFLKNWLAKSQYKFAARTVISKNKYDREYVNISPVSLDRITSSLLDKFDIVIADASELSALPASDAATISNYVNNKGLGLIVKTDGKINSSAVYLKSFPLLETRDSIQQMIKLSLNNTGVTTSPLKIEQPIYIRKIAGTQSLVKDEQMHTMVNSKMFGLGKVVLSTISNTYTWQLAGNNNDYTNYWSEILQKAVKKMSLQETWNVSPSMPQKNEEIHFQLQTVKPNVPQTQVGKNIFYMQQNYLIPYQWNGTYWPVKTGWQPLIGDEGISAWWYVFDNKDWKAVKALDKIIATKKYANDHAYQPSNASSKVTKTITEIPKIYFFIMFVLGCSFLWFEKKFSIIIM